MESFRTFLADTDLTATLSAWAVNLVLALVIYIIGKWVSERVTKLCRQLLGRAKVDPTLVNFLGNIVFAVLMIAVILAALDTLGIPVTSLLAIVAAAGLAVGLALKDSLGNFAAGVMLVMFRPFVRGDLVEVAGVTGVVQEVHIFNTVLHSLDNKVVIIPNGQIASGTITNYSTNPTRRVDLVFSVSYEDDLKVARDVLSRLCAAHPKVLDDPATSILVVDLAETSVDFAVRPWVKSEDYWTVYGDLLEQGKHELQAAGCHIPHPQKYLYLQTGIEPADTPAN